MRHAVASLVIATAAALLPACSFDSATPPGAPSGIDASAGGADARPDARPANTSCHVAPANATGTDRGKVGGSTGGGNFTTIACGSAGNAIGLALDMSNQGVDGTMTVSARGIELACATITIDGSGAHTGMVTTTTLADGNGGNMWMPSRLTPIAQCPAGAVLSGLQVYSSTYASLFLDATMTCTSIDINGVANGMVSAYVMGSKTNAVDPTSASCNAGEQVVGAVVDTGSGLDSLHLFCAPVTCE